MCALQGDPEVFPGHAGVEHRKSRDGLACEMIGLQVAQKNIWLGACVTS